MTLLLRVILVVALSAIVLAIAYVVVTDPGSGTDVIARGTARRCTARSALR